MSNTSPSIDAIQVENILTSRYVIEANELYDYPNTDPIEKLTSCPMNSIIRVIESPNNDGSEYTFKLEMNEKNYLSNGLKFKMSIPLKVTRKEAYEVKKGGTGADKDDLVKTKITEANFMDALFSNNADICLSQFSIYQAISSQLISLNGNQVSNVSSFSDVFNASSQYSLTGELSQWVQASVPDRFQDFETYLKSGTIPLYNIAGKKIYTSYSPVQENNIFSSKYSSMYISRTPEWRWNKSGAAADGEDEQKTAHVILDVDFLLALSIGSTPEDATSFAGVQTLEVSFTMKNNMAPYLFSLLKTATDRLANIVVDSSAVGLNRAYMYAQVFTPPTYMTHDRVDRETNNFKPYSIGCERIASFVGSSVNVAGGASQQFNLATVNTSSTPSHAYISIVRTRRGTPSQIMSTPICYGLIKSLDVTCGTSVTSFSDPHAISLMCDANGYDCLDPQGRASKGYTVKIDFSKDVSMNGQTLVGASGRFELALSGEFMNVGSQAADFQIQVHVVCPSHITFDGSNFGTSSGVIITEQMIQSPTFFKQAMDAHGRRVDVIGAGFFKNMAKGAVNLAKKAWNNREAIGKVVGDVASLVSLVKGGERAYSNVAGAGARKKALGAGNVGETVFKAPSSAIF